MAKFSLLVEISRITFHYAPVAPLARLVNSKPSGGWDVRSNLGGVTRPPFFFSHIMLNSAERPCHGYAEVDFTVDERN